MRLDLAPSLRQITPARRLLFGPRNGFATSALFLVDRQQKDIVPGDLEATLEAHRVSNRSVVRTVVHEGPGKRWAARKDAADDTSDELTPEEWASSVAPPVSYVEEPPVVSDVVKKYALSQTMDIYSVSNEVRKKFKIQDMDPTARRNLEIRFRNAKRRSIMKHQEYRSHHINEKELLTGKVVEISPVHYSGYETLVKPWESNASRKIVDRDARLSLELRNLSDWMQLTREEETYRRDISLSFMKRMEQADSDLEFYQFGSSETGLATTLSDMDIGFYIRSLEEQRPPGERGLSRNANAPHRRKEQIKKLDLILYAGVTWGNTKDHEIVYAKYPLFRMVQTEAEVEFQIVAGRPQPGKTEIIKGYLDDYPQLKPVFFTLKSTLAARGLDEVRDGGLGSYALLMCIVAAFRLSRMPPGCSTCQALMVVLDFYAQSDTLKYGIALEPPRFFEKRRGKKTQSLNDSEASSDEIFAHAQGVLSIINTNLPHALCLQDPADPYNDLGQKTLRILDIIQTFGSLNARLTHWLATGRLAQSHDSPMELLLGNSLKFFQDRRDNFLKWVRMPTGSKYRAYHHSQAMLHERQLARRAGQKRKLARRNAAHGAKQTMEPLHIEGNVLSPTNMPANEPLASHSGSEALGPSVDTENISGTSVYITTADNESLTSSGPRIRTSFTPMIKAYTSYMPSEHGLEQDMDNSTAQVDTLAEDSGNTTDSSLPASIDESKPGSLLAPAS